MTRRALFSSLTLLFLTACTSSGQSPRANASVTISGKQIRVDYSAPSVRGRKIFGPGGLLSNDPTYPVWRAGANSATSFRTEADLQFGALSVPKGDYTLYALVENPDQWVLIISKQTGQWGLVYDQSRDLVRIPMTMAKPPALVETYQVTLTATGPASGELQLAWENHIAKTAFQVK